MIDILTDWSPGEARLAVVEDAHLKDFAIWRPGRADGLGDIHRLQITRNAPSMKGGFVKLPSGESAFVTGRFDEGAHVVARVVRAAQGGKGARLQRVTDQLAADSLSNFAVGPTPLEELAARHPGALIHVDNPSLAARIPGHLRDRVKRVQRSFCEETADQCAALCLPTAIISASISAHFSATTALFAIDMDDATLSDSRTQFSRNVDAFPALAQQIIARNINGVILIDPAGVATRKRPALLPYLRDALQNDPLLPHGFGATPSGLLEFTRPRRRPPLHELLSSPHGIGLAALRQISQTLIGLPVGTGRCLRASHAIITALENDPVAMTDISQTLGFQLQLISMPDYPRTHWNFV